MSKLLNLGSGASSSLKWTHYLRSFIISEKDQFPFESASICVWFGGLHAPDGRAGRVPRGRRLPLRESPSATAAAGLCAGGGSGAGRGHV